jgi:hypothetical protein
MSDAQTSEGGATLALYNLESLDDHQVDPKDAL